MNDRATAAGTTVLQLTDVSRLFAEGAAGTLEVFRSVGLNLRAGELVALVGPSGAGKSSLLHIAGLLEAPSNGEVYIVGKAASKLPERERTLIRRDTIGFVYQAHHLLPEFTALENVTIPQRIAGKSREAAELEATRLLTLMGLAKRLGHRPTELSGGEQQRVAIARALANGPKILLADEPTGNLDPRTAGGVFDALIRIVRGEGLAALVATHNFELARMMDRTLMLDQGKLVESRAG